MKSCPTQLLVNIVPIDGKYLGVTEQRAFSKFFLCELIDIKSLTGDDGDRDYYITQSGEIKISHTKAEIINKLAGNRLRKSYHLLKSGSRISFSKR